MGQHRPTIVLKEEQFEHIAGTEFKALVYLVNVKTDAVEYYFHDGGIGQKDGQIVKDSSGAGVLTFMVMPGSYDKKGKYKSRLKLTVNYKENGKDFSITQDFTYHVRKPKVYFECDSKLFLYKNCANEIKVFCSDFGDNFTPICTSRDAEIIDGPQPGQIKVVPAKDSVYIQTSTSEFYLDGKRFYAIAPPAPLLKIFSGETELSIGKAIPRNSKISIKITPEPSLSMACPKDVKYQLDSVSVTVLRNNKELIKKYFKGQEFSLPAIGLTLASDDILLFEIKYINRINFLNQVNKEKADKVFLVRVL